MADFQTGRDRYMTDPAFRQLVDLMVAHIHQNNFTPSEMRDAAMVASMVVESTIMRPFSIDIEADRLADRFPELKRPTGR